jgi:hypothetical protein
VHVRNNDAVTRATKGGGQKQEQRQESRSKDAKSDEAKASSSEQVEGAVRVQRLAVKV